MIDRTYNNLFWKRDPFLREKKVDGDRDGRIKANLREKPEKFQWESCSSMKESIQSLLQEINAVVFEKAEFEFRDMSELKEFLLLLAQKYSISEVAIIF